MQSLNEAMKEYRKLLDRGVIQKAYKGLMEYMMGLRTHFEVQYPEAAVSGSIYFGYMDMTYFAVIPKTLKKHNLKIAIVFLHESFRFEIWLAGYNKKIQEKYWKMIKESGWNHYHLVPTPKGADSILEHIAVGNPDFENLAEITGKIDRETGKFIADVEKFFSRMDH
jgi:hypothetical protein